MSSETITRNDLTEILNAVLPSTAVDYVVEEGTSGIWTYRKWNSGIAECWGKVSKSGHNINRAWGGWYVSASGSSNEFYSDYPSGLFIEAPYEMVAVNSFGSAIPLVAGTADITKDHTGHYVLARGTSATGYSAIFAFHSIGRWK